jgi:hypothetical protein
MIWVATRRMLMVLTTEQVQELHGRWYDGGEITPEDAAAVSEWIMALEPGRCGLGEVILAMYLTKYVRDGKPAY